LAAKKVSTRAAADRGNSGSCRRRRYQAQIVLMFFWMVLLLSPSYLTSSLKFSPNSFNKCGGSGGECKKIPCFSGNSGAGRRRL
jgi:hypothetical protein